MKTTLQQPPLAAMNSDGPSELPGEDSLGAARGILAGCFIGGLMWVVILGGGYLLFF